MVIRLHTNSFVRNNSSQRKYDKYLKASNSDICVFCDQYHEEMQEVVQDSAYFYVAKNRFPYTVWDSCIVSDHLMLIPKRHTEIAGDFTPEEQSEFFEIIADYEAKGYNFYARAPKDSMKTIPHQHTHLIKLQKKVDAMLFIERPKRLLKR